MPPSKMTANELEFYRSECVHNERNAAQNWKKKYANRLDDYDMVYKYIPGMARCIAGINTNEGLAFISHGGLTPTTPRSQTVHGKLEMPEKCYVDRPKSSKQKVGYSDLKMLADSLEPPREAHTVYEQDLCIRLPEFKPHIRGVNMTKASQNGPWRNMAAGTMEVIPTKWQYPSGTKQPEGHLVRSELRKLRLEKEAKKLETEQQKKRSLTDSKPVQLKKDWDCTDRHQVPTIPAVIVKPFRSEAVLNPDSIPQRKIIRQQRPWQSRSWAPTNNQAPKGWYKSDMDPPKLHKLPDEVTVCSSPQARLNVLQRRLDVRAQVLANM